MIEESAYLNLILPDGPISGFANFIFLDGTSYSVSLPDDVFALLAHDHLRSEVEWRLEGRDGDRDWYYYQVRIYYPEYWADDVQSILLEIGDDADTRYEQARFVDGPDQRMYVYSGYTDIPLGVRAFVTFDRYHPDYAYYSPNLTSQVIEVGDDGSWTDLYNDPAENYLEKDAVTLRARDVYLTETSEGPLYQYSLSLTGTVNLWSFDSVNWILPSGKIYCHRDNDDTPDPWDNFQISLVAGPEVFEVTAELVDGFGQEWTLKRDVGPHAQRNDAIYIDLEQHQVSEHVEGATNRQVGRVFLRGPNDKVQGIDRLEAVVKRV